MKQLALNLDCKVIERGPDSSFKDEPDSRLARDALIGKVSRLLTRSEISRIENLVTRIDWHIDLIYRDRSIREFMRAKMSANYRLMEAAELAASKFNLSIEQIIHIHYEKGISREAKAAEID